MHYQATQISRLGNRHNNQDRCLICENDGAVLLVVADGMGGHDRGELAAQTCIDTLRRQFLDRDPLGDPSQFLRDAFAAAHKTIVAVGQAQKPPVRPMTTAVACLLAGDAAHWAHIGDSRCYLLRDGRIFFQTRDHTPVADMVASGAITQRQAKHHPLRNQVSRCLGGHLDVPEITTGPTAFLQPGDVLLLCSDGLWSALPDQSLLSLLDQEDLIHTLDHLALQAEQKSYPHSDNVSGVAFRWLGIDSRPEAPAGNEKSPQQNKPDDPVDQAIAELQRALDEYGDEMAGGK